MADWSSSPVDELDAVGLSFEGEAEQAVRGYSLEGSGLDAVRFIRIAGTADAGEPGTSGLNLDAVEAINVAPAGVLLADAMEVEEQNAGLLTAETLGSRALAYFGQGLAAVSPAGGGPGAGGLEAAPYIYQPATPLPVAQGASGASGISLLDTGPLIKDAFAFEGGEIDEMLSRALEVGDINGDGAADFMLVGEERAYVLYGPVDITGIENVAEAAEIVFDLTDLTGIGGRPAERMGDIDGDGFADLAFISGDDAADTSMITVFAGRPQFPRLVDAAGLQGMLEAQTAGLTGRHIYQIQTGMAEFAQDVASLHVLNWDGDDQADILVAMNRPVAAPFAPAPDNLIGLIYSGANVADRNDSVGSILPAPEYAVAITLNDDSGGREALADDLLPGFTVDASELSTENDVIARVIARVVGDVDGDGRDDILFADSGFLKFTGPSVAGLPDAGRVYLVPGGHGSPFDLNSGSQAIWEDFALGGSLAEIGDLNRDGFDEIAFGSTAEVGGLRPARCSSSRARPNSPATSRRR